MKTLLLIVILLYSVFPARSAETPVRILLISVDGLHALDVARYVKQNPNSALASLLKTGMNYTRAACARPADSFPGILAITTGGSPASTGVYFDTTYDRSLYPPGVTSGPTGSPVVYDETVDVDSNLIDGGGGIDPERLPLDPARGNAPVYPHNYLRVNTIFEVIKAAGLRTAWSDKHLTDEIVTGPSGNGVDDLYIPEIASVNENGVSITKSLELTEAYDDGKVQAILNEIDGYDHARSKQVGVPSIFGMNFQAVSVAQRLKTNKNSKGKNVTGSLAGPGGYLDALGTPSALITDALNHTDASLGRIMLELQNRELLDSTYIILTAKHGQAPIDPTKLTFISPSVLISLIEAVTPVLFNSGDDAALIWLQDQTQTANAAEALLAGETSASILDVLANESITLRYPDPTADSRTPDIIAIGNQGTIYSDSTGKIAEHGGFSEQDLNVPIIVSNPRISPQTIKSPVQTAQIAPTILQLLGLNPFALQAVVKEQTPLLPGLDAAFATIQSPLFASLEFGTNPPVQLSHGTADVHVNVAGTQKLIIQASSNLVTWSAFATNTVVVGGSIAVPDSAIAAFQDRFYRAVFAPAQ